MRVTAIKNLSLAFQHAGKLLQIFLLSGLLGCASQPLNRDPSSESKSVKTWESTFYSAGPRAQTIGESQLAYRVWSPASEDPKAILIVVHGLRSHAGRYDAFAEQLIAANQNFEVWAYDQLSHGKSVNWNGQGSLPVSGSIQDIDELVTHLRNFVDLVANKRPGRPIYILSHSMGGLVAFHYGLNTERNLAGMIYLAPALEYFQEKWIDNIKTASVKFSVDHLMLKKKKLPLAFFNPLGLDYIDIDKFSHGENYKKDLKRDNLVYTKAPNFITGYTLIKGIDQLESIRLAGKTTAFDKVPLLFMHGSADKITNPAGSAEYYKWSKEKLGFWSLDTANPTLPANINYLNMSPDGSAQIEWTNAYHDLFGEESDLHGAHPYKRSSYEWVVIEWLHDMEAIRAGNLSKQDFKEKFPAQIRALEY